MLTLIHDTHIGSIRSAGTTPQSALALRAFLREQFSNLLKKSQGTDLVLLGDIFDTYNVPLTDLLYVYNDLRVFLVDNPQSSIFCVIGNHDYSTDSSKMSSFQMLTKLLVPFSGGRVQVLDCAGGWISQGEGVYAISHMPNQDLFDAELAKVPPCNLLLVHCNYDNHFAVDKDHSLNMSAEQVRACPAQQVYFAHEHDARTAQGGKVLVGGNQYPSSISDCLAGRDKVLRTYSAGNWSQTVSWSANNYREIDWQLGTQPGDLDAQFIRVVGQATAEEAADANSKVVAWRKASGAFVLSSAVKTLQDGLGSELELQSVEAVRGFDVMAALKKIMSEDDMQILENLK